VEALAHRSFEVDLTAERPQVVRCDMPALAKGGVVVSCPHSGRFYPPELIAASQLDRFSLRRSEDAFVDVLFQDAPTRGAVLLVNEFARAFVDVNRGTDQLDPKVIRDVVTTNSDTKSERVKAGLGVIPRTVGDGIEIYDQPMTYAEAQSRLNEVHCPWHDAIESALFHARQRNGAAILLDCHSMPSNAAGDPLCDVILGDRFGASCAPIIMNEAVAYLRSQGLRVLRNDPYAGGYTTIRHGRPMQHHHVLQIEINRSIYMVEGAMTCRPAFQNIATVMTGMVDILVGLSRGLGLAQQAVARL
jgi:N-formylglutamate amidohydrolase